MAWFIGKLTASARKQGTKTFAQEVKPRWLMEAHWSKMQNSAEVCISYDMECTCYTTLRPFLSFHGELSFYDVLW